MSAVAALSLVVAACGSDDDATDDTTTDTTAAPATDGADTTDPTEPTDDTTVDDTTVDDTAVDGEPVSLDADGDGVVTFGVATPGPRDDGAYYQALVEGIEAFSSENGYAEPIVVDNIDPAQADTEIRNLARQGVDVIAVGASELADPLAGLAAEFPDIFWYCNCGAGQQVEGVAQSADDSAQISYSAGYATGLLLQDTDSTAAAFLGCCDLDFEQEAYRSFELGLQAVDESFTMTYIPTGDFNDVAGATEAFNQATANGAGAVYPFLGGALEPIVQLANDAGVITMSAGASDVCESEDLDYQIAVQFDAGDYLDVIFDQITTGELVEGETFVFTVGEFPFVGAKLCDGTDEQVAALDEVLAGIAAGEFADALFEIKSEVYGF
ncbi:MAG: BMP family ABC transporter substrate-binding protein [Ilumatobacter sp.]|uniref:BMP family lipoprotein n=1 Tax=Ilumatobacter sp. TaxID=1967498 RepID=UPI0032974F00